MNEEERRRLEVYNAVRREYYSSSQFDASKKVNVEFKNLRDSGGNVIHYEYLEHKTAHPDWNLLLAALGIDVGPGPGVVRTPTPFTWIEELCVEVDATIYARTARG